MPTISELAEQLKTCLQESEEVPRDLTSLFTNNLYKLDVDLVPRVIKAFDSCRIKHEALSLIVPQFETPLPPLEPAVFPPIFRELAAPPLELFDLDEHFSTEKARLAQLANKCGEEDLEYFIRECGEVLGVSTKLPAEQRTARNILEFITLQLSEFKKSSQTGYMDDDLMSTGDALSAYRQHISALDNVE